MIEHVAPVAVTSPCVGVCVMSDGHELCEGCGRTLAEIAGWLAMPPARRDEVMAELPVRLRAMRTGTDHQPSQPPP